MNRNPFIAAAFALAFVTGAAQAQSEASALSALSVLPIASVAVGASTAVGASVAVPAVLLATGAVFTVRVVEASARGTLVVLERASDGTRLSLEFAGRAARDMSIVTGAMVTCSVIGAGVVLSVAGEVIAFVPNAIGRALTYNERVSL